MNLPTSPDVVPATVPEPGPDIVPNPVQPDATPPHGLPETQPGRSPDEIPQPTSPVPEVQPAAPPEVDLPGRTG